MDLDLLAQRFTRFAVRECRGVSPLYERLALGIARDPELLALASKARAGQPVPNLFLAAVHELLLRDPKHPLASFYPSAGAALGAPPAEKTGPPPDGPSPDPYGAFRVFCLEYANEIEALIATRIVQTNEVRRCACLLPAFALVAEQAPGRPLALVEIGASAGLNLLWDRYGYDFGGGLRLGDLHSPIELTCELRGRQRPILPAELPQVAARVGIDLHPVDVRDREAVRWLRALVWPEHQDRAELLLRAIRLAEAEPPRLIAGDALELLPTILSALPEEALACVYHTHTVNQFSPEQRQQLSAMLAEQARARPLCRVSIEGYGRDHPELDLTTYLDGQANRQLLANCDAHGAWLEWLRPS